MHKKLLDLDLLSQQGLSRRAFLTGATSGIGALALGTLMSPTAAQSRTGSADTGVLGSGHSLAKAKRVIFLHMAGAPSQLDLFDYKPALDRLHGKETPPSVMDGKRVSTMVKGQASFPLLHSISPFTQHGESGAWVSELLPHFSEIVDDVCFIKSMYTDEINHDPAVKYVHTGYRLAGRPSIGSWINYGLGSDNNNLPSFIVMVSRGNFSGQNLPMEAWGSGFLPSHHQAVQFRSGSDPVLYVGNPPGIDAGNRRLALDALNELSLEQYRQSGDPEILSRINQYEMAFRMQTSVPEVTDISSEPETIKSMYGPDVDRPGSFAANCLLARRLAERNVKFIQLFHTGWDHHGGIEVLHPMLSKDVDQPMTALVKDLKQRGLLEDTLVVWGGEFGRTPYSQGELKTGSFYGRDHHMYSFTYWMAGGGVKPGYTHGETDELGFTIARDPVSIHDFQATLMRLMGIDHERLIFRYQGRDFRLTDVHGHVVNEILS